MTAYNGFPLTTTSGQGLFSGASADGLIQGTAYPDPATRNWLRAGIVSASETKPMFGGIGITPILSPISSSGPRGQLGQVLQRATALANLLGFTVFDQSYNGVSDPANPVPIVGSNQSQNYYPMGSRARIALACSTNLTEYLGDPINQQVSWDFQNNMVVPYEAAYAADNITAAAWSNTAGGEITYTITAEAGPVAGGWVEIAGIVQSGGSGGSLNGMFEVISNTGTSLVVSAPAAAGYYPTYTSGGQLLAGGGALPVTLLDLEGTNSMVVEQVGGLYTWNYSGSAVVVQLTGGTVA